MADVCNIIFTNFFNDTILPLIAYASITTAIIIALSFMVGRAISNPKLTLWAKTESIQIVVSLFTIFFLITIINTLCSINMNEVAGIFDITTSAPTEHVDVYDAASTYLEEAAIYSHNALIATRYHLQAYTVLGYLNAFICDFSTGSIGWGCLFGYSGENQQPLGGYGAKVAALNIFFNSSIISYFSALNFLFILIFVYKGFVFLFLPLGVFLRAMPYMRSFGSLLITMAICFLVVYPVMLSIFYLMGDVLVNREGDYLSDPSMNYNEKVFPDEAESGAAGSSTGAAFAGADYIYEKYFPGEDRYIEAISFAAYAFIAAVFMPSVAMLATIASISYIARLYGEEIDLSRITRMI
ncbi:hypothetical protein KKF81_01300 [Candidatus Micrarchaeota archaeon]|nr:hypothetical protein [Candidatus Micrarchaeota archaeon]MBU1165556.1 hypothetical protein [Candidatus Micrarchaeota archaeon]MBU1886501.1 hypothetical protein [Candidatus Micrarchaeota archaeon]